MDDSTRQRVLLSDLFNCPLRVQFDQQRTSCNGGTILLKSCDRHLGLTEALMGSIRGLCQGSKVHRAVGDLVLNRPGNPGTLRDSRGGSGLQYVVAKAKNKIL